MGGNFEEFSALDNVEKTVFVLGCENWNWSNFKALLSLVKNFVLSVWDARKNEELLGGSFEEFSALNNVEKTVFVLAGALQISS